MTHRRCLCCDDGSCDIEDQFRVRFDPTVVSIDSDYSSIEPGVEQTINHSGTLQIPAMTVSFTSEHTDGGFRIFKADCSSSEVTTEPSDFSIPVAGQFTRTRRLTIFGSWTEDRRRYTPENIEQIRMGTVDTPGGPTIHRMIWTIRYSFQESRETSSGGGFGWRDAGVGNAYIEVLSERGADLASLEGLTAFDCGQFSIVPGSELVVETFPNNGDPVDMVALAQFGIPIRDIDHAGPGITAGDFDPDLYGSVPAQSLTHVSSGSTISISGTVGAQVSGIIEEHAGEECSETIILARSPEDIPDDFDPSAERRRLQSGGCCGQPASE